MQNHLNWIQALKVHSEKEKLRFAGKSGSIFYRLQNVSEDAAIKPVIGLKGT